MGKLCGFRFIFLHPCNNSWLTRCLQELEEKSQASAEEESPDVLSYVPPSQPLVSIMQCLHVTSTVLELTHWK